MDLFRPSYATEKHILVYTIDIIWEAFMILVNIVSHLLNSFWKMPV